MKTIFAVLLLCNGQCAIEKTQSPHPSLLSRCGKVYGKGKAMVYANFR
jgi:hypothetical protein